MLGQHRERGSNQFLSNGYAAAELETFRRSIAHRAHGERDETRCQRDPDVNDERGATQGV